MSYEIEHDGWPAYTVPALVESKRLSLVRSGAGGDWFMSHSPRNGNSYAEGQWGQWVELALSILQHPATELCRADAYAAVSGLVVNDFYTETSHDFTDDEIEKYF